MADGIMFNRGLDSEYEGLGQFNFLDRKPFWSSLPGYGNTAATATTPPPTLFPKPSLGDFQLQNPAVAPGMAQATNPVAGTAQKPGPAGFKFGINPETFQLGISGAGVLGGLALGGVALHQANVDSKFQQWLARRNYFNSVKSYNQQMDDRIRGQYAYGDRTPEQIRAEQDRAHIKNK